MKILVWHWGRLGAGPRFAAALAEGLSGLPGITTSLSLAASAELLTLVNAPPCDLAMPTYTGPLGLSARLATAPALLRRLDRALIGMAPDLAICAMPALFDPLLFAALRRRGIASVMIVHDAAPHPGEPHGWRMLPQRLALRLAGRVVALSHMVGAQLGNDTPVIGHPPFDFGPMPAPRAHGGKLRVLSFGRLLPYKGLDLLNATLRRLDPNHVEARIVGLGPESAELAKLRALPIARVENNWVPEEKLPALLAWADVLLLTHTQASQSGVAAAALGAGRFVVATHVGGLTEQLRGTPGAVLCPPDADAMAAAIRDLPATPPPRPNVAQAWRAFASDLLHHTVAGRADAGYTAPRTREQAQNLKQAHNLKQDFAPCPSASPKFAR